MTRKWFLNLIGLGAAGQTIDYHIPAKTGRPLEGVRFKATGSCSDYPGGSTCISQAGFTTAPPRNGECPVCGTMAPAYVRRMVPDPFMRNCKPNPNQKDNDPNTWWLECDKGSSVTYDPPSRTISCAHCRVRFDQDAEDVK